MKDRYEIVDPRLFNGDDELIKCLVMYKGSEDRFCKYLSQINAEIIERFSYMHALYIQINKRDARRLGNINGVDCIVGDMRINTLMNIASEVLGIKNLAAKGITGKGVGIAFVDTGLYPHYDFTKPSNRVRVFVDLVNNRNKMYDDHGHGTFCTGVAAGNGYCSKGFYRGCAPEANIISIKAMDKEGGGDTSTILKALQWISDNAHKYNIRVVSMSIGTYPNPRAKVDPLELGVSKLWQKGIVVVTAAGNGGPGKNTITTPGISSNTITVGAFDDHRGNDNKVYTIPDFSSRGPANGIIKPDMLAPGVDIVSVKADKEYVSGNVKILEPYTTMSGTSVAAPMIAGICALLLQKYPMYTPKRIKEILMASTIPISGNIYEEGRGRLQIF